VIYFLRKALWFNLKRGGDASELSRALTSPGNAASAKIVLDYPQVKFTDYMSLLKIDGEWKIINKTFDAQPKTK
jgi:putative lumazine-binding protein